MRTWQRTALDVCCGLCHQVLHRGDPVLLLRVASIRRPIVRCPACAGYPPPDNLPPLVEHAPHLAFVPIPTGPDALPFDYKRAAAEREPGEDGRISILGAYLIVVLALVFFAGLDIAFAICRAFVESGR